MSSMNKNFSIILLNLVKTNRSAINTNMDDNDRTVSRLWRTFKTVKEMVRDRVSIICFHPIISVSFRSRRYLKVMKVQY